MSDIDSASATTTKIPINIFAARQVNQCSFVHRKQKKMELKIDNNSWLPWFLNPLMLGEHLSNYG